MRKPRAGPESSTDGTAASEFRPARRRATDALHKPPTLDRQASERSPRRPCPNQALVRQGPRAQMKGPSWLAPPGSPGTHRIARNAAYLKALRNEALRLEAIGGKFA